MLNKRGLILFLLMVVLCCFVAICDVVKVTRRKKLITVSPQGQIHFDRRDKNVLMEDENVVENKRKEGIKESTAKSDNNHARIKVISNSEEESGSDSKPVFFIDLVVLHTPGYPVSDMVISAPIVDADTTIPAIQRIVIIPRTWIHVTDKIVDAVGYWPKDKEIPDINPRIMFPVLDDEDVVKTLFIRSDDYEQGIYITRTIISRGLDIPAGTIIDADTFEEQQLLAQSSSVNSVTFEEPLHNANVADADTAPQRANDLIDWKLATEPKVVRQQGFLLAIVALLLILGGLSVTLYQSNSHTNTQSQKSARVFVSHETRNNIIPYQPKSGCDPRGGKQMLIAQMQQGHANIHPVLIQQPQRANKWQPLGCWFKLKGNGAFYVPENVLAVVHRGQNYDLVMGLAPINLDGKNYPDWRPLIKGGYDDAWLELPVSSIKVADDLYNFLYNTPKWGEEYYWYFILPYGTNVNVKDWYR